MKSYIRLIRAEYEEPHATHILYAFYSCGHMCTGEMYIDKESIIELANIFIGYPMGGSETRKFEIGTEDPVDRCDCHLLIECKQINKTGRCGIALRWSNNREFPYRKVHEFTIESEPHGLSELGLGIKSYANMRHVELLWDGNDVRLFEKAAQQGDAPERFAPGDL